MSASLLVLGTALCICSRLSSALSVDCTVDNSCEGQLIIIPSDTVFDVNCHGNHSCYGSTLVVQSGSTLDGDIRCNRDIECCKNLTVVVFDSDLATNDNILKCASVKDNVDSCDDLNLTLVRSNVHMLCESGACDSVRISLYDSDFTMDGATSQLFVQLSGDCSLKCNGNHSCFGAKMVFQSDSSLSEDIHCEAGTESCKGMELVVYDSDLTADISTKLDCRHTDNVNACDDMKITLVRSKLMIVCSDYNCAGITVYLFDSEFIIKSLTSEYAFANGNLQVYLYGSSVLTDNKGLEPYIDVFYMTTAMPTTTHSLTSTKKPTTTPMLTTTPKPTTTSKPTTTPMITTTTKPTTTSMPTTTTSVPTTTLLPTTTKQTTAVANSTQTTDDGVEHSTAQSTEMISTHSTSNGGSQRSDDKMLVIVAVIMAVVCVCAMCAYYWIWRKSAKVLKTNVAEVNEAVGNAVHSEVGGEEKHDTAAVLMSAVPCNDVAVAQSGSVEVRGKAKHICEAVLSESDSAEVEEMYDVMHTRGEVESGMRETIGRLKISGGKKTTTSGGVRIDMQLAERMADTTPQTVSAVLQRQMVAMATLGGGEDYAAGEGERVQGEEDIEMSEDSVERTTLGERPPQPARHRVADKRGVTDFVAKLKLEARNEEEMSRAQLLESAVEMYLDTMHQEFEDLRRFQLEIGPFVELLIDKAKRCGTVQR